jgi:hypothetical protein
MAKSSAARKAAPAELTAAQVDRYGELSKLAKEVEAEMGELRQAFLTSEAEAAVGRSFALHRLPGTRTSLDRAALETALGKDALEPFTKTTGYISVRVTAVA